MTRAPAALANCCTNFVNPYILFVDLLRCNGASFEEGPSLGKREGAYLQSKDTNTTSPLREHPIPRLQRLAFEPIQRIPCCDGRAGQRGGFFEGQALRFPDQTFVFKDAVLPHRPVKGAAHTGLLIRWYDGAGEVGLVECRHDFVACHKFRHPRTDFDDCAGTIRAGD